MTTQQEQDAEYILEPVAKQLIAAGVSRSKTRTALQAAARRILRIAAQDAGYILPMRLAEKQASGVAQTFVG
jgi:hypothetical protein